MRELGKPAKVDADTRYMIASNTKAMTTLMLARLVDQKKLTWDTPAVKVLPSFKLGRRRRPRDQVLIKHLICACTGHAAAGLRVAARVRRRHAREGAWRCSGTMQPTSKFGELFQYSNPLAAAAGFVGGHVAFPELELGAALRPGDADAGVRSARHDVDDVRLRQGPGRQSRPPRTRPTSTASPRWRDGAYEPIDPARASRGRRVEHRERRHEVRRNGAGARASCRTARATSRRTRCSRGARRRCAIGNDIDLRHGALVVNTTVRHARRPPRRRHDRLPQRHDVAAGARRGRGDPDQRRPGLADAHASSGASCSRCCSTATPEADAEIAAAAKTFFDELAAERKLLTVPADPAEAAKLAARYANPALGDDRGDQEGRGDDLRLRRVVERDGVAQEPRRHDLVRHDRARLQRARVRRRGQDADAARRAARVRLQGRGDRPEARTPDAPSLSPWPAPVPPGS